MTWQFAYLAGSLSCVDSSGTRVEFEVRSEAILDGSYFYYVRPSGHSLPDDVQFFGCLVPHGMSAFRLEGVVNELPAEYRGLGIMRMLLPFIAQRHSAPVYSSCADPSRGETRTESATAVWNRLLREGKASYDPGEDRYRIEAPALDAASGSEAGA